MKPKAKSIQFSGPMAALIRARRKRETRRVMRHQPDYRGPHGCMDDYAEWGWESQERPCTHVSVLDIPNPHGQPGGHLWIREPWRIGAWDEEEGQLAIDYHDGPRRTWLTIPDDYDGIRFEEIWIGSCDELAALGIAPDAEGQYHWQPGESPLRWRRARYMPRWASQTMLLIEHTRAEPLQAIDQAGAIAEGFPDIPSFITYWDKLNAPRGYTFESNPWVHVTGFDLLERHSPDPAATPELLPMCERLLGKLMSEVPQKRARQCLPTITEAEALIERQKEPQP